MADVTVPLVLQGAGTDADADAAAPAVVEAHTWEATVLTGFELREGAGARGGR